MWKVSVTLLLAVVICLGWTTFNAAQAAPYQRFTQQTDAHYRYGHNPSRDYGYRGGSYPHPDPHGRYVPIRNHHPYPGYYNGHRPHPVAWLYAPPLPGLNHYHGRY